MIFFFSENKFYSLNIFKDFFAVLLLRIRFSETINSQDKII